MSHREVSLDKYKSIGTEQNLAGHESRDRKKEDLGESASRQGQRISYEV